MWFVGGPSGVGKSTFGEALAAERNWLHIEVDAVAGDPLAEHGLRDELNAFFSERRTMPFVKKAMRIAAAESRSGIIVTFAGYPYFSSELIRSVSKLAKIRYLYSSPDLCLAAFVNREARLTERGLGRGIGTEHWQANNRDTYAFLQRPELAPFQIAAFNADGSRKSIDELFEAFAAS